MANEWDNEPATLDFTDEATGLRCAMRRGPGGHWCGYVAVPAGHPLFRKDYSDLVTVPAGYMDREVKADEDYGVLSLLCAAATAKPEQNIWPLDVVVRCHGGLTYSGEGWSDMQDGSWWLGFDCAHSGDLCPKYTAYSGDEYRNVEYVKSSLAKLCGDISSISMPLAA